MRKKKRTYQKGKKKYTKQKINTKKRKTKKRKTKKRKKMKLNQIKSGIKISKLLKEVRNKGKNAIHSLHKWTDLPGYINKGSKCGFCKKENTIQYIRSGDLIDIVTKHVPIYYRCKACKILKF